MAKIKVEDKIIVKSRLDLAAHLLPWEKPNWKIYKATHTVEGIIGNVLVISQDGHTKVQMIHKDIWVELKNNPNQWELKIGENQA